MIKKLLFLTGALLFILGKINAQFTPSKFQQIIFSEPTGTAQTNYQLLLELDTQTPIGLGQMNASGSDIRFAEEKCGATNYLDYFIESGINTTSTKIWIRIPSIAGAATDTIYLFYGDPLASPASNFATTFPNALFTAGNNITLSANNNYDWIEVGSDDTLFGLGTTVVTITAERIKVDEIGSCIYGVGLGHQAPAAINAVGNGPGAGTTSTNSGSGGGSYGGVGGTGGLDANDTPGIGGPQYGTAAGVDIDYGSSGGSGQTFGGAGGGCFLINSTLFSLNGSILAKGANAISSASSSRGGGGGSGGGIMVNALNVIGTGTLNADGGNGGQGTSTANDGGGGGGGGRIKINAASSTGSIVTSVNGGLGGAFGTQAPGQPGTTGTTNLGILPYTPNNISPAMDYYSDIVIGVSPNTTICSGNSVTLIASGAGFGATYTWTNGTLNPTNNVAFIPTSSSAYTVTAIDANGCTLTDLTFITLNSLPTVTATISPSNTVAVNTPVTFNGGGANTYVWNGPVAVTDNVSFNATTIATGTYTVIGTDGNNCQNSATVQFTVNSLGFNLQPLIWGASPFQDSLWSIDTTTWTVVNALAPSMNGFTITGINSLAFDPCELKTYAILKLSASTTTRYLATIDLPTGVCTMVGDLGDKFSSLTFRSDGQLFGVTGNGATVPETMYLIDKTNATKTIAAALGAGADGELICFNPADNFIYHWSGNTIMVYEKLLSTNPYTATNIPIIGTPGGETFGAYCLNPTTFITSNIASSFNRYTTAGNVTSNFGSTPDDIRGLVIIPTYGVNKDSLCAKVDSISVGSMGAQWFTAYYHWGDGITDTLVGNGIVSHKYQTAGNKTIHVVITNGTCTGDTIFTKTINVKNTPNVTLTGPNGFCTGGIVTLSGTNGGTSQWYLNGTAIGSATSSIYNASTVGWYNMVKTNLNGCADSAAVGKNIEEFALPTITGSITPLAPCVFSVVTPTGFGGVSYTWTGGLINNEPFVATSAGNYTITGTDVNGCTGEDIISLNITNFSGNLAQALPGNSASVSGSTSTTQNHPDGSTVSYYNTNCDRLAVISDFSGGNILGLTTVLDTVELNTPSYNGQPYLKRWFAINPTSNGAASISLYFTQNDFDDYNANNGSFPDLPTSGNNADPNIANIRVTQISGGGLGIGTPVVITPFINWNAAANYWEISMNVSGFSNFYIHSVNPNNVPLPSSITQFSAERKDAAHELYWQTSSEFNNKQFVIERSGSGNDWEIIGSQPSKAIQGNSHTPLSYQLTDVQPLNGRNLYRLVQEDFNGNKNYSKVVELLWIQEGSISIYPNPAKDVVNLNFYHSKNTLVNVHILDMSGRKIKSIQEQHLTGNQKIQIPVSELTPGSYQIQVKFGSNLIYTYKLIKE